jgi:hypothetical protein
VLPFTLGIHGVAIPMIIMTILSALHLDKMPTNKEIYEKLITQECRQEVTYWHKRLGMYGIEDPVFDHPRQKDGNWVFEPPWGRIKRVFEVVHDCQKYDFLRILIQNKWVLTRRWDQPPIPLLDPETIYVPPKNEVHPLSLGPWAEKQLGARRPHNVPDGNKLSREQLQTMHRAYCQDQFQDKHGPRKPWAVKFLNKDCREKVPDWQWHPAPNPVCKGTCYDRDHNVMDCEHKDVCLDACGVEVCYREGEGIDEYLARWEQWKKEHGIDLPVDERTGPPAGGPPTTQKER